MFDDVTCKLLRRFTTNPPENETVWHGVWTLMMSTLFPTSQRYAVAPVPQDTHDENRTRYVKNIVYKASGNPAQLRTVLIAAVMHSPDWKDGIPLLESEIDRLTDDTLELGRTASDMGAAISKVYWMGVIGPHWCYGVKDDNGRKLKSLIDWHDTADDQASYGDFQTLAKLVAEM